VDAGGDDGDAGAAGAAVNIWRLSEEESGGPLSHTRILHASMPASTVSSYPLRSDVWAIAHKNKFGLISTAMSGTGQAWAYDQLPLHAVSVSSNSIVADLSFSLDGDVLAVAESPDAGKAGQGHVTLWKLPSAEEIERGAGSFLSPARIIALSASASLAGCRFLNATDLVTASTLADPKAADPSALKIVVQVWFATASGASRRIKPADANKPVQTVTISLPAAPDAQPASPHAAHLECSVATATTAGSSASAKYVCVSSRRSGVVAVLSVARLEGASSPSHRDLQDVPYPCQAAFAHISAVNLNAPVFSFNTAIIQLRDEHHTADPVEHLEISCFQEQSGNAGQAAVQQFHTEAALLASPAVFSPVFMPVWMDSDPSPSSPAAPAAAPAVKEARARRRRRKRRGELW
jgi:hypothetical protein